MKSVVTSLFAVLAALGAAEESPRAQYEALVREYDTAYQSAVEAFTRATDDQGRMKASQQRPQPQELAARFFALAEKHPEDPAAIDALSWVAAKCVFGPAAEKALGIIARDHARSERLKDFCGECSRYGQPFPAYEAMLRNILKENPHREVKGPACLALAAYLKMAKEKTESELVKIALQGERSVSKARLMDMQKMKDRGLDAVVAESAALFQKVIDEYPDLQIASNYPPGAAELAKGELFVLRNLCIGRQAPEIVGKDIYGKPMTLSDYRGKVVVLDFGSHRSCGVCRQMYPHMRSLMDKFRGQPFALLGISVDDDVNELKALAEKGENTWPVWWDGEDLEGQLATQWVIRSMPTIFVLDPGGVIRNKGFIQPSEIETTVDMLLKEMTPVDRLLKEVTPAKP